MDQGSPAYKGAGCVKPLEHMGGGRLFVNNGQRALCALCEHCTTLHRGSSYVRPLGHNRECRAFERCLSGLGSCFNLTRPSGIVHADD